MGTPRSGFKSGGGASGGGSGDVTGPASSTDHAVVRFDGAGGKTLQDSGVTIDDSDNVTGVTTLNKLTLTEPATGATITVADGVTLTVSNDTTLTGDPIGGSTGATDSTILLSDGTGGSTVQAATGVTWDPSGSNSLGWLVVPNGTTIATQDGSPRGALYLAQTSSGVALQFIDVATNSVTIREGLVDLTAGNATTARVTADQFRFASARLVGWTQSGQNASGTIDTGLVRHAAAVTRAVGASSSTNGSFLSSVLVEANTATSGSPNVIAATESGTVFTNEGATSENHHDLPTAVAGLTFLFYTQDSDGIQINAASGDTITTTTGTSAAGGFISSSAAGAWIRLLAINATQWVEVGERGTWAIDT